MTILTVPTQVHPAITLRVHPP